MVVEGENVVNKNDVNLNKMLILSTLIRLHVYLGINTYDSASTNLER